MQSIGFMANLKKSLGLASLTFYGTGMILGAGIYSIIGKAAGETQNALWISFILAGIVSLFTGLSYAELSTMFPKAGSEFIYLSQAFKKQKWLAKTVGVSMAFSGSATAATVALAFSSYLQEAIEVPLILSSTILLILATLINIAGIKESGWTNILFTLIEIIGLIIFINLGWNNDQFAQNLGKDWHGGILTGTALVIFSYFGFENIVNLAEETKNPEKNLPRAILLSLLISTSLYVLTSIAALALLEPDQLASTDAALATAAKAHSKNIAKILSGIALFSTANTALIALLGASRILYGMSKAKALPLTLSKISEARSTPWMALMVSLIVALLLLPLGKIETIASISSLATMLSFLSVNIALIALRFNQSSTPRPFRSPWSVRKVPILAVLGVISSFVFILQFENKIYFICGSILTALGLYFAWNDSHS